MKWSNSQGFSLIEVMLAVFILGLSVSVFFSSTSQGIGVVSRARGYQHGRELLNWVELQEPMDLEDLEAGSESGRLSHPELGSFTWERDVVVEGPEEDELYLVKTRVSSSSDSTIQESREVFIYAPLAKRRDWVEEPWDE